MTEFHIFQILISGELMFIPSSARFVTRTSRTLIIFSLTATRLNRFGLNVLIGGIIQFRLILHLLCLWFHRSSLMITNGWPKFAMVYPWWCFGLFGGGEIVLFIRFLIQGRRLLMRIYFPKFRFCRFCGSPTGVNVWALTGPLGVHVHGRLSKVSRNCLFMSGVALFPLRYLLFYVGSPFWDYLFVIFR